MSDAILIQGGSGGIDSSDVTASKADVLEGKTTITSDSNDEVVQGTMPLLMANSDMINVMKAYPRMDQWGMGGVIDSASMGRGLIVALRPEDGKRYALDSNNVFVFIPLADLRAENIRSDKNIGGVQGNIQVIGKIGVAPGNGWFNHEFMFILNIPQGIYEAQGESWAPELRVPIQKVREILGILAHKIAADENIAGVQGTLPVWNIALSGHGDVMYAWAGEGHYYDHPISGRGVILRIPNNHITRGGNWVYLAEPDLIGSNIRKGANMFGIPGEMVDYGAGGVAFNGATFDNRLISGVAEKGKEIYVSGVEAIGNITYSNAEELSNKSNDRFKYLGIRDGGLRFSVTDINNQGASKPAIAVFFNKSINLTPFRRVRVGVRFLSASYRKYSVQNDRSVAQVGIVFINIKNLTLINAARYQYQTTLNSMYKGRHISFIDGAESIDNVEHGRFTGQQLWAEIDVSDVNEHCFMLAYAKASAGYYSATAEMIINHIEFIN